MDPTFPLSRKLFISHFVATFIVSSVIGVFLYVSARDSLMDQLKVRLSSSAALISRDIDARDLEHIRSSEDVEKPNYESVLKSLRAMRQVNLDIAYLYIMRLGDEGRVFFVVDSDESEDQALPGLEYTDLNEQLLQGFVEPSADKEMYSDDWGTFISGYAPVLNSQGRYLVGLDMRADEVRQKLSGIQRAGAFGILLSLLLSWGIGKWMSGHFKKPIEAIIAQCRMIGSGDLESRLDIQRDDEISSIVGALNDMTADLKKSRDENMKLAESLDEALDQDKKKF